MAAAQQPNQSDNSSGLLWIVGAIFVFSAILWFSFKTQIVSFYLKFKLIEINLLSHFTSRLDDVRTTILAMDPSQVTYQDLLQVGGAVGQYLRFPCALILLALAAVVYFANRTRVFKHVYSMRDLVQLEKTNWPQINPIANIDLLKADIDKGPWAMSPTPMQFCKKHQLLEEHKRAPREGMSHRDMNKIEVTLKRGAANKIFATQVGPLWQGIDRLPPHIKALFAIFAARINGDGPVAANLIVNINRSFQSNWILPVRMNYVKNIKIPNW